MRRGRARLPVELNLGDLNPGFRTPDVWKPGSTRPLHSALENGYRIHENKKFPEVEGESALMWVENVGGGGCYRLGSLSRVQSTVVELMALTRGSIANNATATTTTEAKTKNATAQKLLNDSAFELCIRSYALTSNIAITEKTSSQNTPNESTSTVDAGPLPHSSRPNKLFSRRLSN